MGARKEGAGDWECRWGAVTCSGRCFQEGMTDPRLERIIKWADIYQVVPMSQALILVLLRIFLVNYGLPLIYR